MKNLIFKNLLAIILGTVFLPGLTIAQNSAPTDFNYVRVNAYDNQPAGTMVGSFIAADPDNFDTHVFTLVAGAGDDDNSQFYINGRGLYNSVVLDATVQDTFYLRVRCEDSTGAAIERAGSFVIYPDGGPTALQFMPMNLFETAQAGTLIGTIAAVDTTPGDTHTFALVPGPGDTDNGLFTISNDSLLTNAALSYNTQSTFNIRVACTDAAGNTLELAGEFSIFEANVPVTIMPVFDNVFDQMPVGTKYATLHALNSEFADAHTYTLVSGTGDADNAKFYISGNGLYNSAVLDYNIQSIYNVRVQATDDDGDSVQVNGFLKIYPQGNPSDIALTTVNLYEAQPAGTLMANLSTTDPDSGDTHTYSLVYDLDNYTDNSYFTVVGNGLYNDVELDYDEKRQYKIRLETTDAAGYTLGKDFIINIVPAPSVKLSGGGTIGGTTKGSSLGTTGFTSTAKDLSSPALLSFTTTGNGTERIEVKQPESFEELAKDLVTVGYPNPFTDYLTIEYQLPLPMNVELTIFNSIGQEVITLVDGLQPAGTYAIRWNAKDFNGQKVNKGSYLYKLNAKAPTGLKAELKTGKLVKLK